MQTSTRQQRREFSVWLRTPGRGDSYERKLNPWHDPRDGRFTFAGNGRYFGPGDAGQRTAKTEAPRASFMSMTLPGRRSEASSKRTPGEPMSWPNMVMSPAIVKRSRQSGKDVRVKIVPIYEGASQRHPLSMSGSGLTASRTVRNSPMSQREQRMPSDRTEELLNMIGQLLAEDTEYSLDDTLLHAEVGCAFVRPSIFKDRGNHILYRYPDLDRLGDALLDLWEAQQGKKRWREVQYIIRNGRFDATFVYPEEIDSTEEPLDRRRRIVAQYFGEKPIVYPQPDDEDTFEM